MERFHELLRQPGAVLAPMAGFSDAAMRLVCCEAGAILSYTEMVNAIGLVRDSAKTWHLLETLPGEGPVVAHVYGAHAAEMGDAAAAVWQSGRFVAIDINAGCPMSKITVNGCGAALMPQPEKIGAMVRAMRAAMPLPVTVKTRVGQVPDKVLVFEILQAVEEAGAAALTVHGRFAANFHSGPVALELLAAVKQKAHIPIIGNGGVTSAAAALAMKRVTAVDAVMVGRGAMGNPWLFGAIAAALADPQAEPAAAGRPAIEQVRVALERHIAAALQLQEQLNRNCRQSGRERLPDEAVATMFRCHLFRYLAGQPGAARLRGQMSTLRSVADIVAACRAL